MSREEMGGRKQVAPESLFKRYENLTVLSIFVGFVVIIVLWQLIMTGGHRFPTFISPVNILNILQQVGVPGIVAVGMTMVMISGGIDLSVGMLASSGLHRNRAWNIEVASGGWSFYPARHPVGGRARVPDGVYHFAHEGRALHHHAGRDDLFPGNSTPFMQFTRGHHERGTGLL